MPKKEQTISLPGYYTEKILAICYSAFTELNWTVLHAGADKLLANTPHSWNSKSQQVIVAASNNELVVSSEMIHGESLDMAGKNKKNIAAFIAAFETAKSTLNEESIEPNITAINALRAATAEAAETEAKEAEEVARVMHMHGTTLYATYGIMIANALVFILMALDGAGVMDANGLVHLKWGSNYAPLTLSGDWWRLLSNTFIHFGIIHLAMNMYALYMIGIYLEPMLGKAKYIVAYLCTGVLASLTSLWWHADPVNSAGASGAIFGLYGLFLALLTTNLIPKKVRDALLKSIGIFVIYNLAYGMQGGVDNAAHTGGLLSGFVIGYAYVMTIKKEQQDEKITWIMPLIIAATIAITYSYLDSHTASPAERNKVLAELKEVDFKDADVFTEKYNEFVVLQDKALAVYRDSTTTDKIKRKQLTEVSLPYWVQADTLARQMQRLNVSPAMHTKADIIVEYIGLRKEELTLIGEMFGGNISDTANTRFQELESKINTIVDGMK